MNLSKIKTDVLLITSTFILPVATQPRFAKRIDLSLIRGETVKVLFFERNYFKKNTLPKEVAAESLGLVHSGDYFRRFITVGVALFKKRKLLNASQKIYVFSADVLLLLILILPLRKIVYEIGDLRFPSGRISRFLFDWTYGEILRKLPSIRVTSEGFRRYLFTKYDVSLSKVEVFENKLPSSFLKYNRKLRFPELLPSALTIGIIGFLRYRACVDFVRELANISTANVSVKIFGGGPLLGELMKVGDPRVTYRGEFKYPDDLEKIYSEIDISFVVYDAEDTNVRLALPNKLYESIYFRRPLVVASNTFLASRVAHYNIGWDWNHRDMRGLLTYLQTKAFIEDYSKLVANFPDTELSEVVEV